jgi:DNA-binding NarL/FixJ family response regulator
MHERIMLLNGDFELRSHPGKGTTVVAEVPLPPPREQTPDMELAAPKTYRLRLADDYTPVREGMRSMLEGQTDLEVVGEAQDGEEALQMCRSLNPDLILMDVRMPKMDGLEAIRAIKAERPEIAVLMVSAHEGEDYLLEAVKAGAAGYVLKDAPRQRLLGAVRRVLSGESPINQELAMRVLRRLSVERASEEELLHEPSVENREMVLAESLTARELDVLGLLCAGKTNREISQDLHVSLSTVKGHLERLIAKLGVSDRTQAAVKAIDLGLISPAQGE